VRSARIIEFGCEDAIEEDGDAIESAIDEVLAEHVRFEPARTVPMRWVEIGEQVPMLLRPNEPVAVIVDDSSQQSGIAQRPDQRERR
jgi:hypothetical protein